MWFWDSLRISSTNPVSLRGTAPQTSFSPCTKGWVDVYIDLI